MSSPPPKRRKTSSLDNEEMAEKNNNGLSQSQGDLKFDNEYSRLIHAIGKDALKRLQSAKVLVVGLKGLGAEIAKNIVLMGVASLTIHDPDPIEISDLSSQFFFSESDVGKNRAEISLAKLTEMNERVEMKVNNHPLSDAELKQYTVVCLTNNKSVAEMTRINDFCHKNHIAFIAGDCLGLFGYTFVDFGDAFVVEDSDGEPPKTAYIEAITKEENGIVQVVDSARHDLEDGDVVRITEVQGMTELNGQEFKVTVKGPFQFSIGDTRNFTNYIKGGYVEQVKQKKTHQFQPLHNFIGKKVPADLYLLSDYSKFDRPDQFHLYIQALLDYVHKHKKYPKPANATDAAEILNAVKALNESLGDQKLEKINEELITKLAKSAAGDLSPMCAFFGGIIAQEIIKATSRKYTPIKQWFYFDSLECLSKDELTEDDCKPLGSRYDGQIAVFGKHFNDVINNLRYFLVGAGAIGCEILKNWAMMGVGCGPNGHVDVTDMDTIEISNLNRQFLYRPWDISKLKSQTAAAAALKMNPHMNIKAWSVKVAPDTESTYDNSFWEKLSGVCNALDNINARLYVDGRCVFFKKSLLESGTLGTKGNVQVVVPYITESYGSSRDPPAKETPVCLLHSFPNNIEHCLQWAREEAFEGYFVKDADIVNNYLNKTDYISTLSPTMRGPTLETLEKTLIGRQKTFDECIEWARIEFEKRYDHQPRQLLFNFPLDYVDSNGTPFWSGAKRPPKPISFDVNDDMHLDFVVSAAFLRAYVMGINESELKPSDIISKRAEIKAKVQKIQAPKFQPKKGLKITTDEKATTAVENTGDAADEEERRQEEILSKLPAPADVKLRLNPVKFEKDDDQNFHIDFVCAASNLRATSYGINTVDRLKSKLIAGKIIPAIVTTTASITGLVCLELYKLYQTSNKAPLKIEDYRNAFINLALPLFQQSEPIAPPKKKYADKEFSLWDRIDIKKGDITLQEVIDWFRKEHKIDVDMLGVGTALIYANWMGAKAKERLPRKLSELVPEVTKQPLPSNQSHFMLEITAADLDGNDIEHLPDVAFWFKGH